MKDSTLKVFVDVDNTIGDFAPIFYDELRKVNPDIPHYTKWNDWNFYEDYIKKNDFYDAAHLAQMRIMETKPIDYADKFLKMLHKNFFVIIASHRRTESKELLVQWLQLNNMVYDDIHISYDKTEMFDKKSVLVVDDSPVTMQIALDNGIKAAGLDLPWNRCMKNTGAYTGKTMRDIYKYVKKNLEV